MDKRDPTILHVEDDTLLSQLVKTAFDHFGFHGDIITAESVSAAVDVLNEREQKKEPLSLIISDMQLRDGTGLDVIREVKTNPVWRMTPVIVLSNKDNESIINDAYALGASSYIPKVPESKSLLEALANLYQYWLENAKLPRTGSKDLLQEAIERAIGLRTRTSEFYLNLAHATEGVPEEMGFWLNRSLNEGNLANLLAFFRNKLHEKDVPKSTINKLAGMQVKVRDALKKVEMLLQKNPSPRPEMACEWVLELADAMDEEIFAEACGHLFPKSPVATMALKSRAAAHIKELALHILERTEETELRQKAILLLDWSQRLILDN
ncbi:MAG TPA: response regulator [Nitrospirota bacterium]|nr:response regulator [Nitrospirota bacterium]